MPKPTGKRSSLQGQRGYENNLSRSPVPVGSKFADSLGPRMSCPDCHAHCRLILHVVSVSRLGGWLGVDDISVAVQLLKRQFARMTPQRHLGAKNSIAAEGIPLFIISRRHVRGDWAVVRSIPWRIVERLVSVLLRVCIGKRNVFTMSNGGNTGNVAMVELVGRQIETTR
jgi:hypothetical protein